MLGEARAAVRDLRLVLSQWPATHRLDEGLFRAILAVAYQRAGEPEAAERRRRTPSSWVRRPARRAP